MINIRKATSKDEAGVFGLLQQFPSRQKPGAKPINTPENIRTFHEVIKDESKGTVFVAEEDGVLAGLVTLSYPMAIRCGGKYTCIEEFIVNGQMRGKGVGTKLLQAAINEAKQKDCFEMQVNAPSVLGYPVYVRQNIKDNGKHLILRFKG
jgi:N-acetylglutamate synthase-like GNAT family acetyltransferase